MSVPALGVGMGAGTLPLTGLNTTQPSKDILYLSNT
jgi:hypothetical protein